MIKIIIIGAASFTHYSSGEVTGWSHVFEQVLLAIMFLSTTVRTNLRLFNSTPKQRLFFKLKLALLIPILITTIVIVSFKYFLQRAIFVIL